MYLYDLGGDRSDRSLPRNDLHPDSYTKTPVGAKPERVQDLIRRRSFFFDSKRSPRCRHVDADLIRGFEGSAKPGEVAGFVKTAKTPHAGRFPPPRRGPRRRSRLGLLTDLDAARCLSPPRPQRGPRRRRRPSPPPVPRPTPVPPRLGLFNRRPPAWFCGANQETRLPSPLDEWTPQLPPGSSSSTATLRRHSTPVYLQSKDQVHDHTARLTIHSSQAG